jgi:hypothetical protein
MAGTLAIRGVRRLPTFRSYTKSEDAYSDAAFLCGMGLDATVFDERAFGGNLLGPIAGSIRIDLPDEQLAAAEEILAQRESTEPETSSSAPSEVTSPPTDSDKLGLFLRVILAVKLAFLALMTTSEMTRAWTPAIGAADQDSLPLSESLWRMVFLACAGLSNILCFFYNRFGRALFALTLIWALLTVFGIPPESYGAVYAVFGGLGGALSGIALALMYWSPLKKRFRA